MVFISSSTGTEECILAHAKHDLESLVAVCLYLVIYIYLYFFVLAVGACVSYVCWNGGVCHTRTVSNVEEAFCSCQHGFIGKFCETSKYFA